MPIGSTRAWGVAVACLAALLLATPAHALIVPQRGIAGIKLRMTRAQVVQTKGRPDAERLVPNEFFRRQRVLRYGRTQVAFDGPGRRVRVIGVTTRDPRQRTRSGVGVGSTAALVKRRIRGVNCSKEFGIYDCVKGRFRAGERVTVFRISRRTDRVRHVQIGIVID